MRILVIGGSGYVGGLVLPYLADHHDIRVFDRKSPETRSSVKYFPGDVRDAEAITSATKSVDAMIFMAMGPMSGWGSAQGAAAHFDVAVSGLYLALRVAAECGVRRAVYTSSMSVYRESDIGENGRRYPTEDVTPDAVDFYGFAKSLGERVCQNAVDVHGLSVVALRLCHPTADAEFPRRDGTARATTICTSARDTARALLAALDYGEPGFAAFAISGDAAGRLVSVDKARTVLGWEPLDPTRP